MANEIKVDLEQFKSAFDLKSLADLYSQPADGHEYVLDRTLPKGGLSIVAAKPKVGKSTLARNLILAIARGDQTFLGREIKISGPTVYLGLEEKQSEVRGHFQRMGAASDLPIFVHTGSALMVSPIQAIADLEQVIIGKKVVLAAVDPLQRLVKVKDINPYAEMSLVLEPLLKIARDTGCHIMVVHHAKKGTGEDILDAILGSVAIAGSCDTLLFMRRTGTNRTVESIQRYGEDLPCTVLAFDEKTGLITPGGTLDEFQLQQCSKATLELLADHEMTLQEIKGALTSYKSGLIHESLEHLTDAGEIKREGMGRKNDPHRYHISNGDVTPGTPGADILSGTLPELPLVKNSVEFN